ncbi:MAG: PD40 domain-containing protein [Anaerolineales bacterium]|nr:PD40 domain-containing protein [Anaerolineales bacterium]
MKKYCWLFLLFWIVACNQAPPITEMVSSATIIPSLTFTPSPLPTSTPTHTPIPTATFTPSPTETATPTSTPTPAGGVGAWIAFPFKNLQGTMEVYVDEFNMQHIPAPDNSWSYKSVENLEPVGKMFIQHEWNYGYEVGWTPDGTQLVYPKTMEDGKVMLVMHTIATNETSPLVEVSAYNKTVENIKFSPDGKWLMYTTKRDAGGRLYREIWTILLENGQQLQIETRGSEPFNWSSDSQYIYFHPDGCASCLARISPNGQNRKAFEFPRKYRYAMQYVPAMDAVWIFDDFSESQDKVHKFILISLDDFSELRVFRLPVGDRWGGLYTTSPDGRWVIGFAKPANSSSTEILTDLQLHIVDTEQGTWVVIPEMIDDRWNCCGPLDVLAWGPGNTFIIQGLMPDQLNLRTDETYPDVNGNPVVWKRRVPYMLDLSTGEIIFVYAINIEGRAFPNRLWPTFYWNSP